MQVEDDGYMANHQLIASYLVVSVNVVMGDGRLLIHSYILEWGGDGIGSSDAVRWGGDGVAYLPYTVVGWYCFICHSEMGR